MAAEILTTHGKMRENIHLHLLPWRRSTNTGCLPTYAKARNHRLNDRDTTGTIEHKVCPERQSTKSVICCRIWGSSPRIAWVAPSSRAKASRSGWRSTAMITRALRILVAMTPLRPTQPVPKITTELPGCTLRVFKIAPAPVCIPHPRGANNCKSVVGRTRTTDDLLTTATCEKELWPKKLEKIPGPLGRETVLESSSRFPPKFNPMIFSQ